ncbi:bifunctional phosphopantothenoylcysteine decarboxylase/phosphopantothenate--cysteine ligase CoaBC [Thermosediminibacter oceani]|uniref:Coenzyme A biosynthesis bifunctional protein CoaBC n=1 Tax=Thermosediminibacter oceani (strain ATCC BAA-1034 / DSM 16646 / JW/IW-1228P) TaxID=555079 RepID=D9S309_THEOJ|nr:bifunctional phosphopantothenoylcysteine decarboxylase/phosphopantothenate--cysteine ligase CoaBC [Thermosediminibacter oceani]ADL07786.1 Phosphopantothenoylcysteine decarboxylase; Phosphopantothenate-cysteine ligase [Thermosediminibacter oceani DSM 16646]
MLLKDKFIALGVTGSIAAYKAVELVRLLKKSGAQVQVVMTRSAREFVTPLTFQVVSQNPVITDMFEKPVHWEVEHVSLADRADLFVVAPATANVIAKMAAGIADDMLTAAVLATRAKVLVVPAMNVNMFCNPITQENIKYLREKGIFVMDPAEGFLACGYSGKGRFPEPVDVLRVIEQLVGTRTDLQNKKILITAGPTREPIDPVRFISNHSSGKMGYSLAEAAVERGGEVILISGPTSLERPAGLYKYVAVETALEMREQVLKFFPWCDVVIKAAAVADYRPKNYSGRKIKKKDAEMVLELEKNPDILKELGEKKDRQVLVGFAAETNDIQKNALEKLNRKNLDLIVVNDVTVEGAGFGVDTNIVKIIHRNGTIEELPKMPKKEVANAILDRILQYLNYS